MLHLHTIAAREGKSVADVHRHWLRARAAAEFHILPRGDQAHTPATPAVAYVNHGRWVADCPSSAAGVGCVKCGGPCGAAMALLPGEPYLCACCWNPDTGGQPRPVLWPDDATRRGVEAALMVRAHKVYRNWHPVEPLTQLQAETRAILARKGAA